MGILDALFGRPAKEPATPKRPAGEHRAGPPPKAMIELDERSTYTYYVPEGTRVGDVLEVPWGHPREEWVRGTVVALGAKPWPKYPGGPMRPAYTGRCRYARRPGDDAAPGGDAS